MNNNKIMLSELTITNMINLRWDENCGIIKTYFVRGKVVRTENDRITYVS